MKNRPDIILRIPRHIIDSNGQTIALQHRMLGLSISNYLIRCLERQLAADTVQVAARIARRTQAETFNPANHTNP